MDMRKRICGLLLSVGILLCSSACTTDEPVTEITKTPVVAAVSDSMSLLAAQEFCREKGYDTEELYTLTDCAVAVENGKYEYLVCSEYEEVDLKSFKLERVDSCAFKSQYSLCFSAEADDLCQQFNASVKELTDNGTLQRICDSYKGADKFDLKATAGNPIYIVYPEGADGFSSLDDDGDATGIEVDLVHAICNNLGYTPVFVCKPYRQCFEALTNGGADILLGIDSLSSDFGEEFILSDPYFTISYNVYSAKL